MSFNNVKERWFPEVHHHCPGVPFLIVGTQVDLRDDPQIMEKLQREKQEPVAPGKGEHLARELGAVKYVECSALTHKGVRNVFDEVRVPLYPLTRPFVFLVPLALTKAILAALEAFLTKKRRGCIVF